MTSSHAKQVVRRCAITIPLFLSLSPVYAQTASTSGTIEGTVTDNENHPVANADVTLEEIEIGKHQSIATDAQGTFRFSSVMPGKYAVRADLPGWHGTRQGPFALEQHQRLTVRLRVEKENNSERATDTSQTLQFSDEPTFTVAGVTDPTNLGGHGSDVVMRTKESLAHATASLGSANIEEDKRRIAALRNGPDSAELHELLGEIAESEKRPLDAVHEYQRAAEMDPSEPNLFAWGAELLLHRALDPASEVFATAHRRYPQSSRVLIGLGVTSYALGRADDAAQQLAAACDLDSQSPTPYLFLGRMQSAEKFEPAGWTERLKRFAELHPQNAMAHYYYAVSLSKEPNSPDNAAPIEKSLSKAIEIDPHLGDAYLQLGVLYARQKDFAKAIPAYQKAIENTALPDEAHFRLAEAYRLTGNQAKAHDEIVQYQQISKQKTQAAEQERHDIPQFVYTLRGQTPTARPPTNSPQ